MQIVLNKMSIVCEQDVVASRQRARFIAALLGFDGRIQTQIATVVSEIARNAFRYAQGGRVEFSITDSLPLSFRISIKDKGPGIVEMEKILAGTYVSPTGMGLGIRGARRIMDEFDIKTGPTGTRVIVGKHFGQGREPFTNEEIDDLLRKILTSASLDPFAEIRQQNRELMGSLEDLQKKNDEVRESEHRLSELNRELEDTNRGVIALNMELEDKALAIKNASEIRSRFLSHITHEFRTPVNSILSLTRIMQHSVRPGSDEDKQLTFIRKAAEGLSEMVNDLLDNVKVDAGKLPIILAPTRVSEVFGALRAMFKPLVGADQTLLFEEDDADCRLLTDEAKLSQILRNFISNALKFCPKGRIVVSARACGNSIRFSVTDQGIGIRKDYHELIFEEFVQVEGPHQERSKGTGLGLSLVKKLAHLLHGDVSVESEEGKGSIFTLALPQRDDYRPAKDQTQSADLLIIDDDEISRYLIQGMLCDMRLGIVEAGDGPSGLEALHKYRPKAILLDMNMPGMDGMVVFDEITRLPETKDIPVVIHTTRHITLDNFRDRSVKPAAIVSKDRTAKEDGAIYLSRILSNLGLGRSLQ